MTWPVTFNQAIHNQPIAVIEEQAARNVAQLRNLFGKLSAEIVQAVVNAVLTALGLQSLIPVIANSNNQIQNVQNQTAALLSGLAGSLQGLLPAFIDNGDGTLTTVGNNVVSNGDGTLTVAVNAGTTLANTIIDNADGTLMSVATALNNKIQSFGTHSAAINDLNTALNSAGLSHPGQLVTALQGVIPAILDNGDGTLTTLSSQITHNFDGTYTYVAQQAQQGAANLNGLIDNLDGTLMPFYHSVSQTVNNTLGGLLHAFTGSPVVGVTATQAQQAQVTSAAAAIQQRLQTIGNGAEEQVDVEFSAYTNGSIPSVFTTFGVNSGTAPSISGGLLTVTGNTLNQFYYYNGSTTLTDYQQITGVWPTVTQGSGGTTPGLFGRANTGTTFVEAQSASGGNWRLRGFVSNSTVVDVQFTDTFTQGATYSLMCGDPATTNAYKFSILKNGTPLPLASVTTGDTSQPAGQLYYIDTSNSTSVGAATRNCGLSMNIAGGTNGTISMSSFLFQDTTQSAPTVLVTTSETTTSTTYTDLTTTSDAVAVNIGTTGLASVSVSADLSGAAVGVISRVGVQLSGANTQAATDNYSIWSAAESGGGETAGATWILSGLSPGLTVFKLKYKSPGGGSATFANRHLGVVAL